MVLHYAITVVLFSLDIRTPESVIKLGGRQRTFVGGGPSEVSETARLKLNAIDVPRSPRESPLNTDTPLEGDPPESRRMPWRAACVHIAQER